MVANYVQRGRTISCSQFPLRSESDLSAAVPQLTRMGWTGRALAPNRSEDDPGA